MLAITLIVAVLLFIFGLNAYVSISNKNRIKKNLDDVPQMYCAIVLGAKVNELGKLSKTLQDRMTSTLELYRAGKVKKILLSGDHSRPDYNEVGAMKRFLLQNDVPDSVIFMDHKGFDTYSTMIRAKQLFEVRDAIIVTQAYHMNRSLYISDQAGLQCVGYLADKRPYVGETGYKMRDWFALAKAFIKLHLFSRPKLTEKKISVYGDGSISN